MLSLFTIFFHDNREDGFLFGGWMSWRIVQGKGMSTILTVPSFSCPELPLFLISFHIFLTLGSIGDFWKTELIWMSHIGKHRAVSPPLLGCSQSLWCRGCVADVSTSFGHPHIQGFYLFSKVVAFCNGRLTDEEWALAPLICGYMDKYSDPDGSSADLGKRQQLAFLSVLWPHWP